MATAILSQPQSRRQTATTAGSLLRLHAKAKGRCGACFYLDEFHATAEIGAAYDLYVPCRRRAAHTNSPTPTHRRPSVVGSGTALAPDASPTGPMAPGVWPKLLAHSV